MSSINESLLAIVKERRASYVKSLRMLFLSMATLLAFHVLIFEPYLEAQTRLIQVKREQVASVAIESNIEKRREAYAEIGEELSGRIELLLVVMMDDIASDLRELSRDLAPYLPESVPVATPGEEARRPAFQMQMQMQELRPRPGSGFGNAIIQELQSARNWGDVRKIMQPWVAENVIDVRFSEYNESIGSFIDGALSEINQMSSWQPKGLELLPEELRRLWEGVENATSEAMAKMRSLQVMPPEDESWWWTTGGKAGVLGLELERSQGVLDSLLEDAGYEALLDSIESQLEVLAQAETMVSARQAEIEVTFDSFQETISQLLGPLDWLPLNMDDLVAFMPLLVACSLGGGLAWILLKRKRYIEILDTSSERSETVREIAFTLRLDAPSSRLRWSVLFCLVAGSAWIVYANLRLAGLVTEQRANGEPVLGGGMNYSLALNWGFSLVLLVGGGALSLLSLRKKV